MWLMMYWYEGPQRPFLDEDEAGWLSMTWADVAKDDDELMIISDYAMPYDIIFTKMMLMMWCQMMMPIQLMPIATLFHYFDEADMKMSYAIFDDDAIRYDAAWLRLMSM